MLKDKEKKVRKQKKEKDYTLRKNTFARILRVLVWGCLAFLVVRGIVAIIRPDKTGEVMEQLKQVEGSTKENIRQTTELHSFAEEFIKQWQTYTTEEEFKSRLAVYVVPEVLAQQKIHEFLSTSKVTYVNAYRMEEYATGHYDVYVESVYTNTRMVDVAATETPEAPAEAQAAPVEVVQQPLTVEKIKAFKVPIQVTEDGKYIVDGIPLTIDDSEAIPGKYNKAEVTLEGIEDTTVYSETLTNYLRAYYGESGSVTDYYLAADANKEKLYGFAVLGEIEFIGISEIRAFRKGAGEVLCLVHYQIKDVLTQEISLQQCNILIDDSEIERLYIKDMNTKTINLEVEK